MIKDISILSVGNIISQIIAFVGFIFIARAYFPEEIGEYSIVLGIATILGNTASGRYEMTILLPGTDKWAEIAALVSVCFTVFFVLFSSLVLLLLVYTTNVVALDYWFLLPVLVFSQSLINICNFIMNRHKQYIKLAILLIIKNTCFILLSILFNYFSIYSNGLIAAFVITNLFISIYLLFTQFSFVRLKNRTFPGQLRFWLLKNIRFLKYSTPAVFVSSLLNQLPVFLLAAFYGENIAGYFALIKKTLMSPVTIISSAANRIYMQNIAQRMANKEKIFDISKTLVIRLSIPSVLIALIFYFGFKLDLLETLFGNNWIGIDILAMILIPVMAISFVAKSVAGFAILGKNKLGLIYQIIMLFLVLASMLFSNYISESVYTAFAAISIALFTGYSAQLISILNISRLKDNETKSHDN